MAQSITTVEVYESIGMTLNPDGSISRKAIIPLTPATPDPDTSLPVLSKDVPLNQSKGTWVRIYVPREALDHSPPGKLSLIVYYHGGGFILCSAGSSIFHDFCNILSAETRSVIVSVDYRLAPEHRLPAAYDDCVEALHWIKTTTDEWLTRFADLSNCFLMGISAGGNIVYHVASRVISAVDELEPLKIKGLILQQPFFGGVPRTMSESRVGSRLFSLNMCDLMWELCLPIGADRDHEYCNPTVGVKFRALDQIKCLGWKIMVTGCDGDPLIDRQVEFAKMLEDKGVDVISQFCEGFYHGYELEDVSKAKEFSARVVNFMSC